MRNISTPSRSPLPILCTPHFKLIFRRVPFLSKINFDAPSYWFIFVLFYGGWGGVACKLPYLFKWNQPYGLWNRFMPHGTGKQRRQVCQSLLFLGHLIGQPHPQDLVNKPQITPAQYNFLMNHFFRHCSPGIYGSIIKRDKHKTWLAILGLKLCP